MLPPRNFNAANWYWSVDRSGTQVYSSAAVGYVALSDPTYVAWLAATDNVPTPISSEQDLFDYLAAGGIAIPAGAVTSDAFKSAIVNSQVTLVIGQVLFNHENRIRVLEGKAEITKAQFIAGVKALLT